MSTLRIFFEETTKRILFHFYTRLYLLFISISEFFERGNRSIMASVMDSMEFAHFGILKGRPTLGIFIEETMNQIFLKFYTLLYPLCSSTSEFL